jgi:hypothetical protein
MPAWNRTSTVGVNVSAGQLMEPGWTMPSRLNSVTSAWTFARALTRRERNGRFPGQPSVTSISRIPTGMCSAAGRVTTHCD